MSISLSPTLTTRDLYLNACHKGDLELVRVLQARGASVNWRREEGLLMSGLHYAAMCGHGDLVDLLLPPWPESLMRGGPEDSTCKNRWCNPM